MKQVAAAPMDAGLATEILEIPVDTCTAAQAAAASGSALDQTAKPITFRGERSGAALRSAAAGIRPDLGRGRRAIPDLPGLSLADFERASS